MSLPGILHEAGMSDRPEYYSGRGARGSDLSGGMLEKIHAGIAAEYGEAAAEAFVDMVGGMKKLSATDFLLTLFRLHGNDWKWSSSLIPDCNGIYSGDEGSAFGTVFSVLSGMHKCDETEQIRGRFLRNRGRQSNAAECRKGSLARYVLG